MFDVWVVVEDDRGCGPEVHGVFPSEKSARTSEFGDCQIIETVMYSPDFSKVIELAEIIRKESVEGLDESDREHYLFEEVMIAVYGKDVFKNIRMDKEYYGK